MSHHQNNDGVSFHCDKEACPSTFFSKVLSIRGAWVEASDGGWVLEMPWDRGISLMQHVCPNHKETET